MKKSMKYSILCVFLLSSIFVAASLIWIYIGSASPLCITLSKAFFVLWVICFFLMQFYIERKETRRIYKSIMQDRADCELNYAVVKVNHSYQAMLHAEEQEQKIYYEKLYFDATEQFKAKAQMYDSIFLTTTVLVYGKDHEDGKVLEISYDSRPQ